MPPRKRPRGQQQQQQPAAASKQEGEEEAALSSEALRSALVALGEDVGPMAPITSDITSAYVLR